MTDPSPPAAQPPIPDRPMPRLGVGVHWPAIAAEIERDLQRRLADLREAVSEASTCDHGTADGTYCWPCAQHDRGVELRAYAAPVEPPPGTELPRTPSLGEAGSSLAPPAEDWPMPWRRPRYGCWIKPVFDAPPASELLAIADDLNAHGGLDETFVAALLRVAAEPPHLIGDRNPTTAPREANNPLSDDPIASARHQLGIVSVWPSELAEDPKVMASVHQLAAAPSEHQHIWTTTSPMRCVECRRYLRPWWRRTLDRVRRWPR